MPEGGVRFGLRCPPCAPIRDVADFARSAEEGGWDTAWFGDSQFLWREVWATMALAADRTERIHLGTAVTNFQTRDITVTATAAATIEEMAPGRLRLGVGTGDSAIKTLGRRPTRLAEMHQSIDVLRRLLAAEEVVFEAEDEVFGGRAMRVKSAPGRHVPVYMAATGPKALALAGGIADGVIVLAGMNPERIRASIAHVERGAHAAGRTIDDIDVWLAAHTAIADTEDEAARLVKPMLISNAQLGAKDALKAIGIDIDVPAVVEGIYPDVTHAEDWELAMAAADRYATPEQARRYAEHFTLAGPPDLVRARIEAAVEAGVNAFYVLGYSSYELPYAARDAFAEHIIPAWS
jgi:5,10-methylenetetrahydromethanopterin reductase